MRIIERASGNVLLEVPDDQGEMLTDLVEDVQSFQVSELFLEVAGREGVDPTILDRLTQELRRTPTLFVGAEHVPDAEGPVLAGQTVDCRGLPLGGLVVTVQHKETNDALAWAYSQPDGTFSLRFSEAPDWTLVEFLVVARGGLLLASFEPDELPKTVQRLDPFRIITVHGQVLTSAGQPLVGGRVEALHTWAVIDGEGRFVLPIDALPGPEEEQHEHHEHQHSDGGDDDDEASRTVHLEVFGPSGQPLGGYYPVELPEQEPVDAGTLTVPEPTVNWPDSEQPLIASDLVGDNSMFPGISEHPLG